MSKKLFTLYLEGIADIVFFKQYIQHCFGVVVPDEQIVNLEGWTNLKGISALRRMRSTMDNGGINIVILDADTDFDARRNDVLAWKQANGVDFELFPLPNNHDAGTLEDLLEHIINPNNRPIFDCWEHYEQELVQLDIPGRTPPPLTTPAKKTKIYGYLEALLGESQKKLIKEANRNYEDTLHWNLNAEYLRYLKTFLGHHLVYVE
ncbi:MAG: hypothetical protein J6I49_05695 [Bacteroidales bacterium]|nr:hypothetical protein [Bacteroidales bacterium]